MMKQEFKIHSKYNPKKEADRFVENIKGSPLFIIITEPGESYLACSLRKKFPSAKIIAVRYSNTEFLSTDNLWDFVWRPGRGSLKFFLINVIPDEFFFASVFLSWKPSENVWKEVSDNVWKEISEAVKIICSIINTRNYFGKRWCSNIFKNLILAKKNILFDFSEMEDSLFAASGASLENILKTKNLNNFFILSASSALPALSYHGITPSLAVSTDGGFWAGMHLKNINKEIPLAFPLEAYIPSDILKKAECVFLNYGSLLEEYFFKKLNIPFLSAKRNGTVSGTAIELLLEKTKGNIFAAGLDLEYSKGISHARPNMNIQNSKNSEYKMNSFSNILAHQGFDSRSMSTYSAWFSNLPAVKSKRIFRIGNCGAKLENIKSIEIQSFYKICKTKSSKNFFGINKLFPASDYRKKIVLEFLFKIKKEISTGDFFYKLQNFNEESAEKEFCKLVSFSEYIGFLKMHREETKNVYEEKLRTSILNFIQKEEKKYE